MKKCEHCDALLLRPRQKRFCSPGCACRFYHIVKCKARRKVRPPRAPRGARWLPLGNGGFALIDAVRFKELNMEFWYRSKWGYIVRSQWRSGRVVWLHRTVIGAVRKDVDHINGDRSDCRRANLRPATRSQNFMNKRKGSGCTSEYKGVCYIPRRDRWRMQITKNRRVLKTRYCTDEIEAALAYDTAARKHFGAFARVNFPRHGEFGCRDTAQMIRGAP